jgi:hypothetical protein
MQGEAARALPAAFTPKCLIERVADVRRMPVQAERQTPTRPLRRSSSPSLASRCSPSTRYGAGSTGIHTRIASAPRLAHA